MIATKTLACIFQEPCHLLKTLDLFVDLKNLGPFSAMKEKSNTFGLQTNSSFIHPTTHVPCFLRTPYCSRASFPGAFWAAVGVCIFVLTCRSWFNDWCLVNLGHIIYFILVSFQEWLIILQVASFVLKFWVHFKKQVPGLLSQRSHRGVAAFLLLFWPTKYTLASSNKKCTPPPHFSCL